LVLAVPLGFRIGSVISCTSCSNRRKRLLDRENNTDENKEEDDESNNESSRRTGLAFAHCPDSTIAGTPVFVSATIIYDENIDAFVDDFHWSDLDGFSAEPEVAVPLVSREASASRSGNG
jgi:hypothetical protein